MGLPFHRKPLGFRRLTSCMAQELYVTAGVIGVVVGYVFADALAHPEVGASMPAPAWFVAVVFGIAASVLWVYSPLPNRTIGPMGGDTEAGYWGFARSGDEN